MCPCAMAVTPNKLIVLSQNYLNGQLYTVKNTCRTRAETIVSSAVCFVTEMAKNCVLLKVP